MNISKTHKVICVIPAFNEAANIGAVVRGVLSVVDQAVVIDDASQDKTRTRAEAAGAVVLQHVVNRGQGAALRVGSRWAIGQGADIILHFDADGQFLVSDLPALLEPLKNDASDIVFGSRFLRPNNLPFLKRLIIMPLARLVNRWFFKVKLSDPQSGLRAFQAKVFEKIIWQEDRMAHCSEILWLAQTKNLRITETPMTVIYHEYGQKFSGGWKILKDLIVNKLIR